MIEISEETLRGLYLILCGISSDHRGAEFYNNAIPVMNKAHEDILKLGKEKGFNSIDKDRGQDL